MFIAKSLVNLFTSWAAYFPISFLITFRFFWTWQLHWALLATIVFLIEFGLERLLVVQERFSELRTLKTSLFDRFPGVRFISIPIQDLFSSAPTILIRALHSSLPRSRWLWKQASESFRRFRDLAGFPRVVLAFRDTAGAVLPLPTFFENHLGGWMVFKNSERFLFRNRLEAIHEFGHFAANRKIRLLPKRTTHYFLLVAILLPVFISFSAVSLLLFLGLLGSIAVRFNEQQLIQNLSTLTDEIAADLFVIETFEGSAECESFFRLNASATRDRSYSAGERSNLRFEVGLANCDRYRHGEKLLTWPFAFDAPAIVLLDIWFLLVMSRVEFARRNFPNQAALLLILTIIWSAVTFFFLRLKQAGKKIEALAPMCRYMPYEMVAGWELSSNDQGEIATLKKHNATTLLGIQRLKKKGSESLIRAGARLKEMSAVLKEAHMEVTYEQLHIIHDTEGFLLAAEGAVHEKWTVLNSFIIDREDRWLILMFREDGADLNAALSKSQEYIGRMVLRLKQQLDSSFFTEPAL